MKYKFILLVLLCLLIFIQLSKYVFNEFLFLVFLIKILNSIFNTNEKNIKESFEYFLVFIIFYILSIIMDVLSHIIFLSFIVSLLQTIIFPYTILLLVNKEHRELFYKSIINLQNIGEKINKINIYLEKFLLSLKNITHQTKDIYDSWEIDVKFYNNIIKIINFNNIIKEEIMKKL